MDPTLKENVNNLVKTVYDIKNSQNWPIGQIKRMLTEKVTRLRVAYPEA